MAISNRYRQTKEWESAYFQTRRSLEKRLERLSLFRISPQDSVLDLGCGDGLNIKLLQKLGVKKIIGVDPSVQFVTLAMVNNPGIKIYHGSAEKLPFKDSTFDVILVDSVFHHILDYKASLREIKRVLKKGGLLCFLEPRKTAIRWLADAVAPTWIGKNLPFASRRSKAYLGEKQVMKHWLSTYILFFEILEELGFSKIFCKNISQSFAGQYKNEKDH